MPYRIALLAITYQRWHSHLPTHIFWVRHTHPHNYWIHQTVTHILEKVM